MHDEDMTIWTTLELIKTAAEIFFLFCVDISEALVAQPFKPLI